MAWLLRDRPRDLGVAPYGGTAADDVDPVQGNPARTALRGLADAVRTRPFWLLAGGFLICGASTNGLVQPHFIPAAHDHGMPVTTAAGLLAVVGVFDVAGTIFSGWLTDRTDPRLLLLAYYGLRGMSLFLLPQLFGTDIQASMIAFIVFYGLDWVATVPPTLALCRQYFGARAPVVFGWVFASHQIGAALAAFGGRRHPRRHRLLRRRLVRRGRAVPGRRGAVDLHPQAPDAARHDAAGRPRPRRRRPGPRLRSRGLRTEHGLSAPKARAGQTSRRAHRTLPDPSEGEQHGRGRGDPLARSDPGAGGPVDPPSHARRRPWQSTRTD